MARVAIEIDYEPRVVQAELHRRMDAYRFVVAVCHRRMGKTVGAINQLIKGALTCTKERPRFAYVAPTYRMGKATAWDYLKHYVRVVPECQVNESELRVDFPNGGQVRIYGSDNPDALRGLYFDGVVLDEYGLMAGNLFDEVIRPLLADRIGWCAFFGTPNGKNQFYDVAQVAQREPGWSFVSFKASETRLIAQEELAAARAVMTPEGYDQEFECSFEASVKGAVYARELQLVREQGRVTRVPYDPMLPVDTDWDIGVGDATAIWCSQSLYSGEVRLIDYLEGSGHGLPVYAAELKKKPYSYGTHWFPHDMRVREFTTGQSRLVAAQNLLTNVQIAPDASFDDGIHASRMLLARSWFDATACSRGLEALGGYAWDYNTRIHEFKHLPIHDKNSHGADAFRGLAVRHLTPVKRDVRVPKDSVEAWDRAHHKVPSARRERVDSRGGW